MNVNADLAVTAAPAVDATIDRAPLSADSRWARLRNIDISSLQTQRSLLPYAVAISPVIVTSILAPPWLALVMAWPCAWALYRVTLNLDSELFATPPQRAFAAYAFPLNTLLMVWSAALVAASNPSAVASTAFAWMALLCLCVAPACRWSRQRSTRRVALRWSFGLTAVPVLLAQALAAMGETTWLRGWL